MELPAPAERRNAIEPFEALLTILGVVVIFFIGFLLAKNFVITRRLVCPEKNQQVEVDFVCRGSTKKPIPFRVKACSAFANPRKVKCTQACLKQDSGPGQSKGL